MKQALWPNLEITNGLITSQLTASPIWWKTKCICILNPKLCYFMALFSIDTIYCWLCLMLYIHTFPGKTSLSLRNPHIEVSSLISSVFTILILWQLMEITEAEIRCWSIILWKFNGNLFQKYNLSRHSHVTLSKLYATRLWYSRSIIQRVATVAFRKILFENNSPYFKKISC
jgi:hypothetical protein